MIAKQEGCPRRYRHRYLDGWQEKDTRAAMLFGRAFEQALAALFRREDPAAILFEQWSVSKDMGLTYSGNDTWDPKCGRACNRWSVLPQTAWFAFVVRVRTSRFGLLNSRLTGNNAGNLRLVSEPN